MEANHEYCLDTAARLAGQGRILDYGCGAGELVAEGLTRGLDIYGADVFYDAGHRNAGGKGVPAEMLEAGRVLRMDDGRLPFPAQRFDFVVSNQVFEHVADLSLALSEIRRVLRPSGRMLSLFPTREVIREGHCGSPLAHRLPPGAGRRFYLATCNRLGIGNFIGKDTPAEWAAIFDDFLRDHCVYRSSRAVRSAFEEAGFTFERLEPAYAEYRLRRSRLVALAAWPVRLPALARFCISRLGGIVVLSRSSDRRSRRFQSRSPSGS